MPPPRSPEPPERWLADDGASGHAGRDGERAWEPRHGDIIGGRFRIGRRLGSGGMGTVYAATHVELGETFALKFLNHGRDAATVQRFLREASAAARLKDEHVVRVFDVGRTDRGDPFFVMEYLDGAPLAADEETPMGAEQAAGYALQICEALADAHVRGIVHRDLKPANLLLTRRADGRPLVKVLDFGISKLLDEASDDQGLTTTGAIMGSPSYTSPEQILQPKNVDTRADLWGLGVTFYGLLSGERPFAGETPIQTYMLVLNATPVPLAQLRPDLPPHLCATFMRCLEKDRKDRFADVAELARELEPHAGRAADGTAARIAVRLATRDSDLGPSPLGPGSAAGSASPSFVDASATTRDDAPPMERYIEPRPPITGSWARPRRTRGAVVGLVGLGLAGAALAFAVTVHQDGPAAGASAHADDQETGVDPRTATGAGGASPTAAAAPIDRVDAGTVGAISATSTTASSAATVVPGSTSPANGSPGYHRPVSRPSQPPARDPRSYR